ncbi:MAG: hypothetical protein M9932_18190 [Xanthobacteraceae bacterium]|nr:hypothetical protein [Xanthobacteraceae bacterium]
MQTTTERPARVAGALYFATDISPDQLFEAIGRLRREAQDEIDRLLTFLDETDGYSTTEQEMEDDEAGGDDEPSLGFQAGDIFVGRGCEHGGSGDDREVEDEHDEDTCDREGDELQHGGDEHDGCEPDEDGEPSLGWTEQMAQGQGTWGSSDDKEESGSYITDAARQRYRPFDRYTSNRDGKHVDTERGFGYASRCLTNLSDQQRAAVSPRLNRDEVRL